MATRPSSICPTQLIRGRCWLLSQPGQACLSACGEGQQVDLPWMRHAPITEVAPSLQHLYGIHPTNPEFLELPCGEEDGGAASHGAASYIFEEEAETPPLVWSLGRGRWRCRLSWESYSQPTRRGRLPCVCSEMLSLPPPALFPFVKF